MPTDSPTRDKRGPNAVRNAVISLGGAVVPALVALAAIPALVHALGAELFGLLSFVWIVFGTFAVLDFGTGRATTKYVAELVAGERMEGIPALFWTASAMNLGVGLLCGLVLFFGAPWLSAHVVKVPPRLSGTAIVALRITAVALPWIVLGGVFRSALEGLQRFDLSNAVQVPVSALNYLAPLAVARSGASLPWVIASVCLTRISAVPPLLALCRRQLPMLGRPTLERRQFDRLLRFGSWLTVSNVIGPFLLSIDRLLVGSVLGVRALGLYAPVYELVTRLSLVPGSVMTALFPAFSTLTERTAMQIRAEMRRAQRLLALLMLPVVILGVTLAPIILQLWLGDKQTPDSVMAMQLLLVGLLVLSVGAVPFTLVQALGRPKWSAMVHMVELPVHAAVTWFAVSRFGVIGAAAAWSLRAMYDAALFDAAVSRMIGRGERGAAAHSLRATTAIGIAAGVLSVVAMWLGARSTAMAVVGAVAMVVYAIAAWRWALEHTERETLWSVVRRFPRRGGVGRAVDTVAEPAADQASRL